MNLLYLNDLIEQHSIPEKFHFDKVDSSSVLIIDLGTCQCRVGNSTESSPNVVFDTIVHKWKDETGNSMIKIGRGIPAGTSIRPTSRSPFENGILVHTPTLENIFDFIFEKMVKLNGKKEGISIILTETPMTPPHCRQEVLELLFEGYNCVERVAFALDGPAVVAPIPSHTKLNIHIGAHSTHIYPIIEGCIDWAHVKRLNWGGAVASDFLLRCLGLKYPGILNSTNPHKLTPSQVQILWQESALVASSISEYEREMDSISDPEADTLAKLDQCIRLIGNAESEKQWKRAAAAAKHEAELNQAVLQEKRRVLADKLRQKGEEQRASKLKSKEHIFKALQGLQDRVLAVKKKKSSSSKTSARKTGDEDEDISMDFSDDSGDDEDGGNEDNEYDDVFTVNGNGSRFSVESLGGDVKLFNELIRLGFKSLSALQEGLKKAEEEYCRLSNTETTLSTPTNFDFSILEIPDSELNEVQIKEKRRLRLIKSGADARERMRAEKAVEEEKRKTAADALEFRRHHDLQGWRAELYTKRSELLNRLIRRQKQRIDRKGATQGSRFRSVVALGESLDESTETSTSSKKSSTSSSGNTQSVPDSGPDDGFGMNDEDWLVYRQVSRDDEDDLDLQDQEALAGIEQLLEEKDSVEFLKRLEAEQYASLTLLDRLVHGGRVDSDPDSMLSGGLLPTIHLNSERMRCTEGLFQPLNVQGIDQAGLTELLSLTFSAYSHEVKRELARNIIVSGGGATISGLGQRIENDIRTILPDDISPELNITMCTDTEAAWKGIKALLERDDGVDKFEWISKSMYTEGVVTKGNDSISSFISNPF